MDCMNEDIIKKGMTPEMTEDRLIDQKQDKDKELMTDDIKIYYRYQQHTSMLEAFPYNITEQRYNRGVFKRLYLF